MASKVPRSFCFTISNWEAFPPVLPPHCDYLVCQQEVAPTTGTPHLQGYCHLTKAVNMKKLKSLSVDWHKAHIEAARGTPAENTTYCTKAESRVPETEPFIFGSQPEQGKRTDMEELLAYIQGGASMVEVSQRFPGQFVRHYSGVKKLMELHRPPPVAPTIDTFHPWEQHLMDVIAGPPHDRLIYFVVDYVGGSGKSTFALYLEANHGALVINPSKYDRINENYEGQSLVIFDYPRSTNGPDHALPYSLIEQIKNGRKAPGMYGARGCVFPRPHVFVFTNSDIDRTALSADRLVGSVLILGRPTPAY